MNAKVTTFETQTLKSLSLKGLGPKSLQKLASADVHTAGDLLAFLPRAYADYSKITPISNAPLDVALHIRGRVLQKNFSITAKTRTRILEILVDDGSGTMRAIWFNQAWMKNEVEKGQIVSLFGKVRFEQLGRTLNSPKLKVVTDEESFGEIEPIYRQVGGLTTQKIREWIMALIELMPEEAMEEDVVASTFGLPSRKQAFAVLHAPTDAATASAIEEGNHPARRRLVIDEFIHFQHRLSRLAEQRKQQNYTPIEVAPNWLTPFTDQLPFALTGDQNKVLADMGRQLATGGRLHALIQGDVGCGKTVVGLAMAALFARQGLQSALLCPTTVLANQHFETASALLEPLGLKVVLLTSRLDGPTLRMHMASLANGEAHLAVGTHRLFQKDTEFKQLGLVLIDEQHRFGVDQRAALLKKGRHPHYLAFSATPIPRSLAMTVHGDYEVYQIQEKPANRTPVRTILKKAAKREEVEAFARYRISLGEGVFWVFPLIEGGAEEEQEEAYQSAVSTYEHFRQGAMPDAGLVHGKMSSEEIAGQMQAFREGKIKVLVATTVIEVGVDIPHASVMVVEGADRFGLSQLHQLRGRVGRGGGEGFCFMVASEKLTRTGLARLEMLRDSNDGFRIAEFDLQQRGAGDLLGKQQSGLARFRFGDPWLDRSTMAAARRYVQEGGAPTCG